MKILYCNKYNFAFSGTEVYLFDLMEMMRSQGHEVALFSMADERGKTTPHDRHFVPHLDFKRAEGNLLHRARLGLHAIYSWDARRRLAQLIDEFRPDVAHIRNIYHHLSPSILWALKARGVPVIYHVNDFKLFCPTYNLVRGGHACEECADGAFHNVLSRNCYTGSWASAVVLASEAYVHKWLATYRHCVDRVVAPSQFVKQIFVRHGWHEERIEVLPHFQRCADNEPPLPETNGPILYFGRLSAEKGVSDLLYAMREFPNHRLQIAGEGSEREHLQRLARELGLRNIDFLGRLDTQELNTCIGNSQFTVFPSHAYETFGKSILESYACARAVVASDLGSRRELVKAGETGLLFPSGDVEKLASAIREMLDRPEHAKRMGHNAYVTVRKRYTPEDHYTRINRIYEDLANGSRSASEGKRQVQAPMRIAFIGGRGVISKYSGIESYYEEVGKRLAEKGHEVTAYCRSYFTSEQAHCGKMRLVRLPSFRSKHLETLSHTFLSTLHAIFGNYDIVHYHALGPSLFSCIPRLVGKKTVVTVQGLDWQRKKWGALASTILRCGERASVAFPDCTVVVSKTLRQHYRMVHGAEAIYLPNGTTIRSSKITGHLERWGLSPRRYVLFMGRFSPEKNCHQLVNAFENLDTKIKLVLAGGASHTDEYVKELRSHESERILFLDWLSGDALDEILTNAMLFVLPSDLEGLSLALLDAMAAGVPVLTSDIPENRELVEGAGFTFRRGDVCDLKRMLRALIEDDEARESAQRHALQRIADQYLWPDIATQMEQVYRGLFVSKNELRKGPTRSVASPRERDRVA